LDQFNNNLLIDCDFLTKESIVLDIGANIGIWTEQIYNKYHPKMYCFEPVKYTFSTLKQKFKDNPDFKLYRFGLGSEDRDCIIYTTNEIGGDASEFLEKKRQRIISDNITKVETCKIREFISFVNGEGLSHIDLMTLNCEGGEYEIMEHLIDKDYVKNIYCLLISFHTPECGVKVPDYLNRMNKIRDNLSKTHVCEWCWPGIWEKWIKL